MILAVAAPEAVSGMEIEVRYMSFGLRGRDKAAHGDGDIRPAFRRNYECYFR